MTKGAFKIAVFVSAFLFAVTFVYLVFPSIASFLSYPTDASLERRFFGNKQDFNTLLALFQDDRILRSVNRGDGAWIDFGEQAELSRDRLQRYNELLEKLEIQSIRRFPGSESVELRVWSSANLFIGGKYKYFVHDPNRTGPLTDSLDEIFSSGIDANHYKRLEQNWYIYLDVW